MATIVEAIYENGVLKPLTPAGLKERHKYKISLEEAENSDQTWLMSPIPELGNIVFHEDPSLPLDNVDWPEESDETDS
jgi:predicted DNA-binding antitoxin AbrB/MazE fold protein